MGLLQKACETYDCFEHLAGKYEEGKEPLAPISHITTAAKIEITLDQEGKFLSARAVDKSETKIIIPVTEASAGRTSAPCPHPLCDQLCYLANYDSKKHQLYVEQLTEWNQSEYTHPKLNPILKYVQSNRILADLQNAGVIELDKNGKPKDEKALVRWRVNGLGIEKSGPCWADQSLMQAFIQFYANKKKKEEELFCMITGRQDMPAKQHIKGVVPIDGNAKLISANDESGFTYRGRFFQNWQAATISYTASQKAHNALRWIAVNEGVRMSMPGNELSTYVEQEQIHTIYGGRTFLCWSPQGVIIPHPAGAMSRKKEKARIEPTEYKDELKKTLAGWKRNVPETTGVVIAAFDAATTGRLALTYYNELKASDFLERLAYWDETCCWENGKYGVQPPSLFQIVNCAFGTYREKKDVKDGGKFITDEKILRQQMQRLISCRIDKRKFPDDIERYIVQRVSKLSLYKKNIQEQLLFCACAVVQKYHYDHDREKERWSMQTELNIKDRSFQFGRLLAVLEKTEQDYYYKKSKEERETNAIRMMAVYCQRPWSTYRVLNEKLRMAYLARMKMGNRIAYAKWTDEIVGIIHECSSADNLNHPLKDTYLLGYHLQRKEMYKKSNIDEKEADYGEEE